jgi:hypothetical protein
MTDTEITRSPSYRTLSGPRTLLLWLLALPAAGTRIQVHWSGRWPNTSITSFSLRPLVAADVIPASIILLIAIAALLYGRPRRRSRLLRATLWMIAAGAALALLSCALGDSHSALTAAEAGFDLTAIALAAIILFALTIAAQRIRRLIPAIRAFHHRTSPLAASQIQPPPESGRSSRSWRRTVRATIITQQSWTALERSRLGHRLLGGLPLLPIEDTEAVTVWDGAPWGIARWRVPVDDPHSATPLTVLVIRPLPHGAQPTVADRAARIALLTARHLPLLVLTPFALLIAAGLIDPPRRLELLAAEALLVGLYVVVVSLSCPATRVRRGPTVPLDAQTALRRMRNRGYHLRDHRLLWEALAPSSASPDP